MNKVTGLFIELDHDCPRCGVRHGELHFRPFTKRPYEEGCEFSHYATCPTNWEPIMYRTEQVAYVLKSNFGEDYDE